MSDGLLAGKIYNDIMNFGMDKSDEDFLSTTCPQDYIDRFLKSWTFVWFIISSSFERR